MIRIGIEAGLACSHRPTGVEYFARELTRALCARTWPGVALTLYLPPHPPKEFAHPPGAKSRIRPGLSTRWRGPWITACSWIDRLDVLFSFGNSLPRWSRGRKIVTLYDTIFCEFPESYPPGIAEQQYQSYASSLKRAHAVAVCSQATAENLRKYFDTPIPAFAIGGAPRSCFFPQQQQLHHLPIQSLQSPYFLFVGRLDKRKNPIQVVKAYRLLLSRGYQASLVLVGPPDSGSAELEVTLANHPQPGERIFLPGYLEEPDLVALYQGAAAFVYPSLAEGYGLPVLEAAACGTPIIASSIPAVQEVARDFSLLVDPLDAHAMSDAMARIIDDADLRTTMSSKGLEAVGSITWENCAHNFINGIFSLFSGKKL